MKWRQSYSFCVGSLQHSPIMKTVCHLYYYYFRHVISGGGLSTTSPHPLTPPPLPTHTDTHTPRFLATNIFLKFTYRKWNLEEVDSQHFYSFKIDEKGDQVSFVCLSKFLISLPLSKTMLRAYIYNPFHSLMSWHKGTIENNILNWGSGNKDIWIGHFTLKHEKTKLYKLFKLILENECQD